MEEEGRDEEVEEEVEEEEEEEEEGPLDGPDEEGRVDWTLGALACGSNCFSAPPPSLPSPSSRGGQCQTWPS